MKDGKEISTYQVESKHYELEEVQAIAVKTEKEHKEYMEQNFGKAQKEEFEETLEIAHFNTYGRDDN